MTRSFQQYYGDRINEWMRYAIEGTSNRTNSGNIKKPSYKFVTDICNDFALITNKDMIKISFELYGIFEVEKLHTLLKKLICGDELNENELFFYGDEDNTISISERLLDDWKEMSKYGNSFFRLVAIVFI